MEPIGGIENLHPQVVPASGGLFVNDHYRQAVLDALVALEERVRTQSRLDESRDLMAKALGGDPPLIDLSVESGQSGKNEQHGLKLLFMGVSQGVRNPKALTGS